MATLDTSIAEIFGYSVGKIDLVADLVRGRSEAEQRTRLVLRWLECNAAADAKVMVEKFSLSYAHEKALNGGVAKIGFYTDSSYRFKLFDLHLPSAEWFYETPASSLS